MIGHLINTDIYGRNILKLYLEYRRDNFDFLREATSLFLENLDRVLVVSCFPIPPMQIAETDGPPGALAIYRTVEKLGGKAEILTCKKIQGALRDFKVNFAKNPTIEDYSLLISVETPGRAKDGKYYSMSALEIDVPPFDELFLKAKELGIPTIGIGDGGNEIGMGNIRDLVCKHIKFGEKIGSVIEVDSLVLSAVSNWGAYGLIAQASIELGKNMIAGWEKEEEKILRTLISSGIIDGVTKKPELSVDGIPLEVHKSFLILLNSIVENKIG
ncbi:DUF4392 domain-containing protein [Thermococcus alcaliphilus]|uniref:DUF4392 domain-containing protein n=1 Tax=Thermococcus alcaliphilus TaxID=139207 RepID=UPI0020900800|nr:DUF4392 domain-containing protein [Thermococcus alcaliphilus]MCO6040429.1 DUF4392 domain-containing protein [Thermococcus alcaliphilus]